MFGLTYKENTQYAISVRGRWLTEVTEGDTSYGVRMYVDYTDGTREHGLYFVYGSDGSWTCITNASKSVKKIGLIYNRHGYYAMKIKIEKGTKATDWTPAPEDVDAAIAAVDSKAQALEYLQKALALETDVTGGIVATTSIQLRDKVGNDYVVNAGLSGVKDDNILLWGGGDYTDAVSAKNNTTTYNKVDNTPITTLLKKNGTGKIGIFKISETQAVVDVPNQGKVVIDASNSNGGIRLYDSNNNMKIGIMPKSISSYVPAQTESVTTTTATSTFATKNSASPSANKVYYNNITPFTAITTTEGTNYKTIKYVSAKLTSFVIPTLYLGGSFKLTKNASSAAPTGTFTMNFVLRIMGVDVATGKFTKTGVTSGAVNQFAGAGVTFTEISHRDIYLASSSYAEVYLEDYTANAGWSATVSSLTLSLGALAITYSKTTTTKYEYPSRTIIGTDGFVTVDKEKCFAVNNGKMYARGLPDTKPTTTGMGELYVSNANNEGLVSALINAMTKIKECLATAKYDGSNAVAQDHATASLNEVIEDLKKISIVANS
jgi:hypothetical protein